MSYEGPNRRRKRSAFKRALVEFGREPEAAWHHIWRDYLPALAIIVAFVAVAGVEGKVDQAKVDATIAKRLAGEQQVVRYRAVYTACLERNVIRRDLVVFLAKDLQVSARTVRKAHGRFPQEPDCKTYTKSLLGKKAPKGAFDLPEAVRRSNQRPPP